MTTGQMNFRLANLGSEDGQEITRKDKTDVLKAARKMTQVSGDNVVGSGFQGAFDDFVVARVRADAHCFCGSHMNHSFL